ncbi:MAG: SDR family NAD(P)-dependent oxidoreductase [Deinococcota bacterium]
MTTVSILGCGWLGHQLADALVAAGYHVKGSTTRENKRDVLRKSGIEPYVLRFTPRLEGDIRDFFACDVLVVTIPPKPPTSQNEQVYLETLVDELYSYLEPSTHLIVTSSTSVYAKRGTLVDEADDVMPESGRGQALRAYEQALQQRPVTILRLAGLFGQGRQPGRFLAGRTNLAGATSPVNMVHGDDVVAIICQFITQLLVDDDVVLKDVFNVCADSHPTRQDFFTRAAELAGLTPSTFNDDPAPYAVVDNRKLKQVLPYAYKYGDVLEALTAV